MAEVTAMRNNALPYPVYGVAFTVVFPLLDADGDPVSPSSPDSEVSLNGNTFADCTNEATEIATASGVCYLTLTAAEMTADIVTVRAQSTGGKTTIITLYPRKLPVLSAGTCQGANDTGDIQLAAGDSPVDDAYNGCLVVAVIDGVTEARLINDYVGSTKVAEVAPAWNTAAPDNNDTYTVYLPEGRQVQAADVRALLGTAWLAPGTAGTPDVNAKLVGGQTASASGTVTFPNATLASTTNITAGTVTTATNLTNLPTIPANWLTAAGIASGALNGKGDWLLSSGYTAPPSAASISTTVWAEATRTLTAFGFGVAVTTNNDKTGYSLAADQAVNATKWGGSAVTGMPLPTASYTAPDNATITAISAKTTNLPAAPAATGDIPTAAQNADGLLGRNVAGGSSAGRTVSEALFALRNKVAISGGTMTVYSTDDATPAWAAAVTGDAAASPIVSVDPG